MARCPHCDEILSDEWLKKMGATIMGKASGESKARTKGAAKGAAKTRWKKERNKEFST